MSSTIERIQEGLKGLDFQVETPRDGTPQIRIGVADVTAIMTRLRDVCGFDTNIVVTAVDRHPSAPRYDMCWQFLSVKHNDRMRVHAFVAGPEPRVPTITHLWPGTAYSERECFDMFGVVFDGHVGLKRLLMPEDYDHFPLRKDFPHQGIEPDRLYREWDRNRRQREPLIEESTS